MAACIRPHNATRRSAGRVIGLRPEILQQLLQTVDLRFVILMPGEN